MDTGFCIAVMVLCLLCFAVLLAWLAVRGDPYGGAQLTFYPPEKPQEADYRIRIDAQGQLFLTILDGEDGAAFSPPAQADGEDRE